MRSLFSTTNLKSGLLAFGLAAAVSIPSFAAPLTMPSPAVPQNTALPGITQVRASWAGGGGHGGAIWRHHGGWHGGGWHGGGRWHGGGWRGGGWHGGGWYGGDYWAPGLLFGLGAGLPYYDYYYDPGYYAPGYYYAPRRVYHRVYRGGDAHVRWCYAHYRSYRASDNTFQPNHGPRRQCVSPY